MQQLLVCGDGGLQGAFIAGALANLVENHPSIYFNSKHIFATSASVATLFYYLGHNGPVVGRKIWTEDIPNSNFLNLTSVKSFFSGEPIYNIDLLIENIFKRDNPLDIERIKNCPFHFAFPIINIDTKKLEIFSNKPEIAQQLFPKRTIRNWLDYDIYEVIKASCAIPILYDKPVKLGVYNYSDAGTTHSFLVPEHLPFDMKALYITTGVSPQWSADLKVSCVAALWWLRASMGKTGLPAWVYSDIIIKPWSLVKHARKLAKLIPNHIILTPSSPLESSLVNSNESAKKHMDSGHEDMNLQLENIFKRLI